MTTAYSNGCLQCHHLLQGCASLVKFRWSALLALLCYLAATGIVASNAAGSSLPAVIAAARTLKQQRPAAGQQQALLPSTSLARYQQLQACSTELMQCRPAASCSMFGLEAGTSCVPQLTCYLVCQWASDFQLGTCTEAPEWLTYLPGVASADSLADVSIGWRTLKTDTLAINCTMSAVFHRELVGIPIPQPTITGSLLSPANCPVPVAGVDKNAASGFIMCNKKHAELCRQHGVLQAGSDGVTGCSSATRVTDDGQLPAVSLKGVQGQYKPRATYGFGVCERLCKAIGAPCNKQTLLTKLPAVDAAYANITYLYSRAAPGGAVQMNCTLQYTVFVRKLELLEAPGAVMLAEDTVVTGAYTPPRRAKLMGSCSKG